MHNNITRANQILDEASELGEKYLNTYKINVNQAFELFRNNDLQKLDFYYNYCEIILKHFNIKTDVSEQIKAFVSNYISSHFNTKSTQDKIGVLIAVSDLNTDNRYVCLPRSTLKKGHSFLYPILDVYRYNRVNLFESEPIEGFATYIFKELSIMGPISGGTHRTVGMCESYLLIKEKCFKSEFNLIHNRQLPHPKGVRLEDF